MGKRWLFFFLITCFSLHACTNLSGESTEESIGIIGNPTAEDILSNDKNADIFNAHGVIYSKAVNIEWVSEQELVLGEKLLEIKQHTINSKDFEHGSATKLPIGTKIYKPKNGTGPILIAVLDGKKVNYIGLIEG